MTLIRLTRTDLAALRDGRNIQRVGGPTITITLDHPMPSILCRCGRILPEDDMLCTCQRSPDSDDD